MPDRFYLAGDLNIIKIEWESKVNDWSKFEISIDTEESVFNRDKKTNVFYFVVQQKFFWNNQIMKS